jgi:hypothetical protein
MAKTAKIPVAFTPFFDSLLGLSGDPGKETVLCRPHVGAGLSRRSAAKAGHKNTEINPVFRGMSLAKSRDLNQRKYCD